MTQQMRPNQVDSVLKQLVARQGNKCAICNMPFSGRDKAVLDHDHDTGFIRGALHNSCNGTEGRIKAVARRGHRGVGSYDYLIGLGKYLEKHSTVQVALIHPTHMTPDQQRIARNAKARASRARKKGST